MLNATTWGWTDPKGQRKLLSVKDYIFWSYSVLTVSRIIMNRERIGQPIPYSGGRTKAANIMMSKYLKGDLRITDLDRDDALSQRAAPICAHFGCVASSYHLDHLIPRSKLNGHHVALNQVLSCPRCNLSRRDSELMAWHRRNKTFPSLGVLRRYLKLCHVYSEQFGYLDQNIGDALQQGLPFDPRNLPRKFPPVEHLVWDYAWPDL